METTCAWCNKETGLPQGDGSHGICRVHAALLLAQWRKRRTARKAEKEQAITA